MTDFGATLATLEADIEQGLYTRGVQVCVSLGGEAVLDACLGEDGLGRAVRPDTLFRVYCTIKPITALAVARLVDREDIDLDQPLAETLGSRSVIDRRITARRLLNHTAGLHQLSGVTMEMVPPGERRAVLDRQRPPPGWRVGLEAGYSEYAAWMLLGELVEVVTGETLREHLRRAVLDPLDMRDTWVGMTGSEFHENIHRIGVNVDLRGFRSFPMLFERTERICVDINPAHGGYTNARDLVRLYGALLRARSGEVIDGLPSADILDEFCRPARPLGYDAVLDRECDYGLGFMVGLDRHFFGRDCSALSFGHSGNLGSSFAFADPAQALAVAVVFNGLVDHESAFVRRPRLVRAIYADLDLRRQSPAAAPVRSKPRFDQLRDAIRRAAHRPREPI
jgi:CubicO group peptidase (beta-lactamase class C family)